MKNNKGFSLVELIIVIAIMAVLIGLLAPQYLRFVQKSKVSSDVSNAQSIATAFNVCFAEGSISASTNDYATSLTSADTTFVSAGVSPVPAIKADKNATSWKVSVGSNGVSSVKVTTASGDIQLWPTPSGAWADAAN